MQYLVSSADADVLSNPFSIRLPLGQLARMQAAANGLPVHRTRFIRQAIERELARIEREAADPSLHRDLDDGER